MALALTLAAAHLPTGLARGEGASEERGGGAELCDGRRVFLLWESTPVSTKPITSARWAIIRDHFLLRSPCVIGIRRVIHAPRSRRGLCVQRQHFLYQRREVVGHRLDFPPTIGSVGNPEVSSTSAPHNSHFGFGQKSG